MPLKMDTSKTGLEMFFKPWQVQALDHLQQIHPRGANSRGVHRAVSRKNAISRTSIIIFLDRCVDDGLMSYTEATGKGGRHTGSTPWRSRAEDSRTTSRTRSSVS
jgi:hypothetical protein